MIGNLKTILERGKSYGATVQLAIMLYLFFDRSQWDVAATLLWGGVVSFAVLAIDWKFVMPKEFASMWKQNPEWVEFKKEFQELKERMGKHEADRA